MKNWFKEKFIEHQLKKREEEAAEKLEYTRLKQFFVVATIHAITKVYGREVHHIYVLKENGSGTREVDITSSDNDYKEYAMSHGTYVKYVYTWKKGTPWDFIPPFFDVYTQQKAPYNNVGK